MYRIAINFLDEWLASPNRKPLVIRGARQVGKTWIVRHLAEKHNKQLIEINFEKNPQATSLFASNDPKQIILNLSAVIPLEHARNPILFLDEIQAAPEMLAKLRWFFEDMPELPIIAAGSLLEFAISSASISMPVGRISYMHLEPLSFEEFLVAHNKNGLIEFLKNYNLQMQIPQVIHQELLNLCKEYIIIGGMPQAVSAWINSRSLKNISQVHNDLLATYRDDFSKYRGRLGIGRLEEVLVSIPRLLGQKFVYSKVETEAQSSAIKNALDLLCKARVCHKLLANAANGLPLAAEINEKFMKVIFLDVGLCSAMLGLSLDQLGSIQEIDLINKGGIAEQLIGQLLRTLTQPYIEPALYYWQRVEKGSSAEIDYIMQYRNSIIPIEVKAGSTGSLKSLHFFMDLKKLPLAVRINSDLPHITDVTVKNYSNQTIAYKLISLPFYLVGQLPRLLIFSTD